MCEFCGNGVLCGLCEEEAKFTPPKCGATGAGTQNGGPCEDAPAIAWLAYLMGVQLGQFVNFAHN